MLYILCVSFFTILCLSMHVLNLKFINKFKQIERYIENKSFTQVPKQRVFKRLSHAFRHFLRNDKMKY